MPKARVVLDFGGSCRMGIDQVDQVTLAAALVRQLYTEPC
jgi:hypothetical protein